MLILENPLVLVLFITLLAITSYTDIRFHRIANIYTLGGIFFALLLQFLLLGIDGFISGLGGVFVGLLLLLPFYLAGGMAAGDVKLMAAAGGFLGFKMTFPAVAFSLISGGLIALVYIALRGELKALLIRYFKIIELIIFTKNSKLSYTPPDGNEAAAQRFPYAIAITAGCLITLAWYWH